MQLRTRHPQLAKEPLLTSRERGNPENRVFAKILDLFFVEMFSLVASFFWEPSYWVMPVLMWSLLDRMGRGQSPGKWLLGLHTLEVQRGYKPNFYHGFIRNFPFILLCIGIGLKTWVWFLIVVPVLFALLVETYFIFNVRSGLRVGDVLGNTRVCDYKDEHTKFIEQFLKTEEPV